MPMQRSARSMSPPLDRSVRAARVRATLPLLHTQRLSRSPTNCPHKRRSRRPNMLVNGLYVRRRTRTTPVLGGGGSQPSGDFRPQTRRSCWSRRLPYAGAQPLHYSSPPLTAWSPQKLRVSGGRTETFGFWANVESDYLEEYASIAYTLADDARHRPGSRGAQPDQGAESGSRVVPR
jgi:hypothetical protein